MPVIYQVSATAIEHKARRSSVNSIDTGRLLITQISVVGPVNGPSDNGHYVVVDSNILVSMLEKLTA